MSYWWTAFGAMLESCVDHEDGGLTTSAFIPIHPSIHSISSNHHSKKSETRRPQALDDPRLFDLSRPSSASTSNSGFPISDNTPFTISFATPSSSAAPPALPALSTGSEFRTSLIFPEYVHHLPILVNVPYPVLTTPAIHCQSH